MSDETTPDLTAVLASTLVSNLRERGQTVATCESLTAGLLAATIAGVPGASAVLRGGLITYATDTKNTLAGVDFDLLAERGPVDPEVAGHMAEGARSRCGADWGISLTGVAGPATAQDTAPVGTVYCGISGPTTSSARRFALTGDRDSVRHGAVREALASLIEAIATQESS